MGCDLPAEPQMEFVRKTLDFLEDGQAVCPSLFVYWNCAKETKSMLLFRKTTKVHTKNCDCCCTVLQ